MALFYFHLCSGDEFVEDQEGTEAADAQAAYLTAVQSLRGVMAGDVLRGYLNIASFIEIEDEQRSLVRTVPLTEVVALRDEPCQTRLSANGGKSSY